MATACRPAATGARATSGRGREVVDEALAWLASHRDGRFFLWVHLFEPHAPYGDPANSRGLSAAQRYDEEITEADRQAGRIVEALAPIRNDTVIVAAADHGESFGEHGEVSHSIFLYDTTLRVPLIITGPGVPAGRTVGDVAALIDVAPTVIAMLGVPPLDADGIDLRPAFDGTALPARELYAETFAPLLDFGWSPLHALRSGTWKYIDAPRPELFDIARDPMEEHDLSRTEAKRLAGFHEAVARRSGPSTPDRRRSIRKRRRVSKPSVMSAAPSDPRRRTASIQKTKKKKPRGWPRSRRASSAEQRSNMRSARFWLQMRGIHRRTCGSATCCSIPTDAAKQSTGFSRRSPHISHPLMRTSDLPRARCLRVNSTPPSPALARCRTGRTWKPFVIANLGLALSDSGHPADAFDPLQRALTIDPDLHQARFGLAVAFARAGRPPTPRRRRGSAAASPARCTAARRSRTADPATKIPPK